MEVPWSPSGQIGRTVRWRKTAFGCNGCHLPLSNLECMTDACLAASPDSSLCAGLHCRSGTPPLLKPAIWFRCRNYSLVARSLGLYMARYGQSLVRILPQKSARKSKDCSYLGKRSRPMAKRRGDLSNPQGSQARPGAARPARPIRAVSEAKWREIKELAERVGFEPTVELPPRRISSAVLSTTQPPLRVFGRRSISARALP